MSEVKAKILCVEDEQDIRENISDILRDEGFEVFEAKNGKDGFDSFLKNKPHLIISDIMMPEVDGYGLLKLVREDKTSRNSTVPFIFLTALGQKDNVIKGVKLTANDYLVKPIDFDLMIAKAKEKTSNAIKVEQTHNKSIKNIKSQFSNILPSKELFSYISIITQISSILKEQPYGKFPDSRYLEDLDKIITNINKINTTIVNFLDKSTVESMLNPNEEIISISNFFEKFISRLNDKLRAKINFEKPFEFEKLSKVKIDKLVLVEGVRKILSSLLKIDFSAKIEISLMFDRLNQMIVIFYVNSQDQEFNLQTLESLPEIIEIFEKENCVIEIPKNKSNSLTLTIPSYRLIEN